MTSVHVVSIGRFENGSFGVCGIPVGGAELFRVDCPELREMEAKAAPAIPDYSRFTFRDRAKAEAAAKQQEKREIEREAARVASQPTWDDRQTAMRREVGLPEGVLANAKFVRVNGSVGILMPGMEHAHFGAFTVNAQGEFVAHKVTEIDLPSARKLHAIQSLAGKTGRIGRT